MNKYVVEFIFEGGGLDFGGFTVTFPFYADSVEEAEKIAEYWGELNAQADDRIYEWEIESIRAG